jgi:hypothetical protein
VKAAHPVDLGAQVQAVGQGGRSGEGEGVPFPVIVRDDLFGNGLLVIERREQQARFVQRGKARTVRHRDDRFHRMPGPATQRCPQPLADSLDIEAAQPFVRADRIGAHLPVEHAPAARPERHLAEGLADIDDDECTRAGHASSNHPLPFARSDQL